MGELDLLYAQFLTVGFVIMRQAVEAEDRDWIDAELDLLHNVPSLIGELNANRHRYFWFKERPQYIEWASAPGREEAKSRMLTYYGPIWDQIEPLVTQLAGHPENPLS